MDVSLDDYIIKKGGNQPKSGLAGRLGPKASPQRLKKQIQIQANKGRQTQFKVTGLAKSDFDARRKILGKKGISIQRNVQDARSKIGKKPNITIVKDARQKITGPRQIITGPKTQGPVRNQDLRQKIKGAGGKTIPVVGSGNIVKTVGSNLIPVVSGGGNVVKSVGGSLIRTINTNQQTNLSQKARVNLNTGRGNKVTINAGGLKVTTRQQVDATSAQQLPGNNPKVKIRNDHYVPPPTTLQQHQQPQYYQQPVQQQPYQYQTTPQHAYQHQPMYSDLEANVATQVVHQAQEPIVQYQQQNQPAVVYQPAPEPQISYAPVTRQEPLFTSRQPIGENTVLQSDTEGGPFRVMVTNLHPIVSQDDLVELFGSIGALKRARLVKAGVAEVLYMHRNDALTACKKYHMRELDGQAMQVNIAAMPKPKQPKPLKQNHQPLLLGGKTSTSRQPIQPPSSTKTVSVRPPSRDDLGPSPQESLEGVEVGSKNFQPLRLGTSDKEGPSRMDMQLIHKALFKTSTPGQSSRPVTFTVKI